MIIDSHVHFFESPRPGNPFTDAKDHLHFGDVLEQARAIGIDRIVQVTPGAMNYDNSFSFEMADRHPDDIFGVIAMLDPSAGDAKEKLHELMRHPRMLILRIVMVEKRSEGWLVERTLDDFFAFAQDVGVPIELFAPFQVEAMHATVNRFPGIRWLIDHIGVRYYAKGDNTYMFRQWPELLKLAQEPQVWIKCSYFPEAAKDIEGFPYPIARGYFRQLYDLAGPDRLIWGSNFPNVRRACTYRQALDFIRVECDFLGDSDRDAILAGNLQRYVASDTRLRQSA